MYTQTLCCVWLLRCPWTIHFSVHSIFSARILEWVVISFFKRSPWVRKKICVPCISRQIPYHWATWKPILNIKAIRDISMTYGFRMLLSESGPMICQREDLSDFKYCLHHLAKKGRYSYYISNILLRLHTVSNRCYKIE